MANVEQLREKAEKARERVEKSKLTIARHEKTLSKKIEAVLKATGIDVKGMNKDEVWSALNPRENDNFELAFGVSRALEAIVESNKKLIENEKTLSNWELKLDKEVNQERFMNDNAPQVLKDFVQAWKEMAHEWYIFNYNFMVQTLDSMEEKRRLETIAYVEGHPEQMGAYLGENGKIASYWENDTLNIRSRGLAKHLEESGLDYMSEKKVKSNFGLLINDMYSVKFDDERRLAILETFLENERKAKLLDLVYRITHITGEITDAEDLYISEKGNLDGTVIGEKGTAVVNTIGAGGYNIQCFHYRTLVKELKNK